MHADDQRGPGHPRLRRPSQEAQHLDAAEQGHRLKHDDHDISAIEHAAAAVAPGLSRRGRTPGPPPREEPHDDHAHEPEARTPAKDGSNDGHKRIMRIDGYKYHPKDGTNQHSTQTLHDWRS
ncbi:hypothetical protein GCM10017600_32850 [Streptosporangium carneum]|uniref:Uncharacterized protein n=1 Tax=Streptosporangium carneum TaxID=47481 RepID=A0A9W6MCW5_9ACTN|nr:hypothetical protein GCM10017600_32850 [Streptosporangium carneum]